MLVLGTPVEGIYLAARALLEPDHEVIVTTPAYDALVNVFEHVVGPQHVRKWAFQPTEEGWTLDLDELQALINERTRLLVINFPHNPTGFLPTPAQFHELIEIVETHKLWLFADEMYYGLVHAGVAPLPSAADVTPRAIVLSGLSKTYGLPGLRTGWLVIQDEALRADFLNWKFYTSICPPGPSEFLAMAALQVGEQLRTKNLEIIAHNLRTADHFFARWPDLFTWRRPMAGSVALVGMDVPSVSALSAKMAAEAGILIQSAATLGYDDRHMRMGFGRTNMTEALEHFEEYLTQSL